MKKKDTRADDAQDFSGVPASTTVTAADIQQKEFRVSRFGGYRMRDVDEFLDHVTEAMTKLSEDNQRLRSASGLPVAPSPIPIGAPDLADTSRQADEIIQRARAEAASILQEAREQAGAGEPTTDAGRAAVAVFLSQEKEFLQQLASLVQGHAESVKGMAKAGRSPAKPSADAVVEPSATKPPIDPEPPRDAAPEPPGSGETPETPETPEVREPVADPRPTEPIRVAEPATASVATAEGDEEGAASEGDRTLRELFWGEE